MHKEPSDAGLLAYRSYGGWGVQRPGHGTLGRYSPDMTKVLPDGHTVALTLRLDRAAYQLYREAGAGHDQALHNSLLCPAWAGIHNAPGLGTWEIELQAPPSDRVELVAMLWPQDDRDWLAPRGDQPPRGPRRHRPDPHQPSLARSRNRRARSRARGDRPRPHPVAPLPGGRRPGAHPLARRRPAPPRAQHPTHPARPAPPPGGPGRGQPRHPGGLARRPGMGADHPVPPPADPGGSCVNRWTHAPEGTGDAIQSGFPAFHAQFHASRSGQELPRKGIAEQLLDRILAPSQASLSTTHTQILAFGQHNDTYKYVDLQVAEPETEMRGYRGPAASSRQESPRPPKGEGPVTGGLRRVHRDTPHLRRRGGTRGTQPHPGHCGTLRREDRSDPARPAHRAIAPDATPKPPRTSRTRRKPEIIEHMR